VHSEQILQYYTVLDIGIDIYIYVPVKYHDITSAMYWSKQDMQGVIFSSRCTYPCSVSCSLNNLSPKLISIRRAPHITLADNGNPQINTFEHTVNINSKKKTSTYYFPDYKW